MKLAAALVERASTQIEADAIPDDHPSMPQLNELFGDHTFFLGDDGLEIVEPAEPVQPGTRAGKVVRLAIWNSSRTGLAPHPPEATDVVVLLGAEGGDGAA